MNNKCVFIGTSNQIPEYTLGSSKQIKGEVETFQNGNRKVEAIKSPSWRIGQGKLQFIKDYKISLSKGQVQTLSDSDLSQNPITFKGWTTSSPQQFIKCSGQSGSGNNLTATGSLTVKKARAIYQDLTLQAPLIGGVTIGESQFWHLTIRLRGTVKLESQSLTNGTIGILSLIKAKRTAKDETVTILDSKDQFILHSYQKSQQEPVLDLQKVINGSIINNDEKINSNTYQIDFPLNQILRPENQSYTFNDTVRTYLFFKGTQTGDIWHPIGFKDTNASSPSYIEWTYQAEVSYHDRKWKFVKYQQTTPQLVTVSKLPEWDKSIWN